LYRVEHTNHFNFFSIGHCYTTAAKNTIKSQNKAFKAFVNRTAKFFENVSKNYKLL